MANFKMEDYVPVNVRLERFYNEHPQGRVTTEVLEHDREAGFVLIKASLYREADAADPSATGHAFESRAEGYVNKTSYIENCETSAVGRALANLGYEIKHGIASREEMQKVERMSGAQRPIGKPQTPKTPADPFAEKKAACGALFRELNAAGDSIKWNGDTIDGYVQSMFEVNGIEDLSLPTLDELIADLETRKKTLAKAATA